MYVFWDMQIECAITDYRVEYELTNQDQCQETEYPHRVLLGYVVLTDITISGLLSYSTYTVYITPINDVGFGVTASVYNTTQPMGMYNGANSSYIYIFVYQR